MEQNRVKTFKSTRLIRYECLLLLILGCVPLVTRAQLDRIPRATANVIDTQQISGLGNFLLTTTPKSFLYRKADPGDTFQVSIQIIDPIRPWPPVWYYTVDSGLLFNAEIQPGKLMSFVRYVPVYRPPGVTGPPYDVSLIIAKGFSIIDTINVAKTGKVIDVHDMMINDRGEKLLSVYIDTTLDVSQLTNNTSDTAVKTRIYVMQVLNKRDQVVFEWNPLGHIPVNERYLEYGGFGGPTFAYHEYDWNHQNSEKWADDGNIIFSYKNNGLGKVNRKTGELMWTLGMPNMGIHLDKDVAFYGQHDFRQIQSGPYKGKYSVVSNGDDRRQQHFKMNIYDVDEKNKSAKLIRQWAVDSSFESTGSGSYTWVKNVQVACRGVDNHAPGMYNNRLAFATIADSTDKILGNYYLPGNLYVYRIECLTGNTGWPAIIATERPVITLQKDNLVVKGGDDKLTWYELVGDEMNCVKTGEGNTFHPQKPGVYIVTRQLALGTIISEPYRYQK